MIIRALLSVPVDRCEARERGSSPPFSGSSESHLRNVARFFLLSDSPPLRHHLHRPIKPEPRIEKVRISLFEYTYPPARLGHWSEAVRHPSHLSAERYIGPFPRGVPVISPTLFSSSPPAWCLPPSNARRHGHVISLGAGRQTRCPPRGLAWPGT